MWKYACLGLMSIAAFNAGCTGVISDADTTGSGSSSATGGSGNTGGNGTGGDATGGNGSSGSGSSSSGNGGSSSSAASSSSGGGGSGPTCASLTDGVRVTNVTIASAASGSRVVTAARGDGSVVAWTGNDGKVHALSLDAKDMAVGNDIAVEGTGVFGVAATATEIALLVTRAPDFMTFVRVSNAGQTLSTTNLVGGGNHATVGVEWFGEFAKTGRLVMQPDGKFAVYHALHRRWPDNIGHQGDTLRILNADGSSAGGGWGWGCSHSMDERLAVGPAGLVPICISDCYPGKGIYFNHNASMITDDPGANCAGGYTTALGGLAVVADGFFLVYQDASGGSHLGKYAMSGQEMSNRMLTEPGTSRLARYEDGLLLGSDGTALQKLNAAGEPTGEKVDITAPLPNQDFESRPDGSVAWASVQGTAMTVVRVLVCL